MLLGGQISQTADAASEEANPGPSSIPGSGCEVLNEAQLSPLQAITAQTKARNPDVASLPPTLSPIANSLQMPCK